MKKEQPKRIIIRPTLSHREAEEQYEGHFLSSADYDVLVRESSLGILPSGELKFLFLKGAIPPKTFQQTYSILSRLQFHPVKDSLRAALKGSRAGGHLVMGFVRDKITKQVRYSAPTVRHMLPAYMFTIMPLLNAVSVLIMEHLPDYWRNQVKSARLNGRVTSLARNSGTPTGQAFTRPTYWEFVSVR